MRNVINAGCADTARLVDMAEGSPERVPHGLLPEEREAIIALSKDETHADFLTGNLRWCLQRMGELKPARRVSIV